MDTSCTAGISEVINISRTEAYARWAQLPWFKPVYDNDALAPALGEGDRYVSPAQDGAPWTDPDVPESYGFYGCYPLDVGGLEDSSRTSVVVESTQDGGNPGRLRHGTKTVVFSAVLVGEDDAAVNHGFMWLKQVLLPGPCGPGVGDCSGLDLCYLASEPMIDLSGSSQRVTVTVVIDELDGGSVTLAGVDDYDGGTVLAYSGGTPASGGLSDIDGGSSTSPGSTDADGGVVSYPDFDGGVALRPPTTTSVDVPSTPEDAMECLTPLRRSLRKVTFNAGPTITAKRYTANGGAVWTVSFTAVAGEPWEYGEEVDVIEGFLDPKVEIPWAGGVVPDGGYLDYDGHFFNESACAPVVLAPLQDPHCLAVVPPPLPPSIPLGCFTPPKHWRRRQITIPRQFIPLWGEVVPKFAVHARHADVRNLRLRFYADVDGDGDISDDPCAFCGDLVVSYVPKGSTLTFDTSQRQVTVTDASHQVRRADNLVFSTDGTPFSWPVLTCGMGYVVTLDLPKTQKLPVFDLSLFSRVA